MTGLSTLPSTRDQARHALLLLGVPTSPRLLVEVHTALFDGDLSIPSLAALIRDEERSFSRRPTTDQAALPLGQAGPLPDPAAPPLDEVTHAANQVSASGLASGLAAGSPGPDIICPGLNLDLTAARGIVTLSSWPLVQRIHTPATARAESLAAVIRVTEFIAARPGATAAHLLRHLATLVPGGFEALDVLNPAALAEAARTALAAGSPRTSSQPRAGITGGPVVDASVGSSAVDAQVGPSVGPSAVGPSALGALIAASTAEASARAEAAERATHLPRQHQLFGIPTVPHQRGGA